jgi:anti-anti-sigma factor
MRRLLRPSGLAVIMMRPDAEETIVEVRGALDAKGAKRLKLAVSMAVAEGARQVTIDLAGASRIGAPGVAALVEATQRAGEATVQLAQVPPEVRLLLEKAGLHMVLEIGE